MHSNLPPAIFPKIASGKSKSKKKKRKEKTHPATLSNTSDNRTKEKDILVTSLKIFTLALDHTTQETATLLGKNAFAEKAVNGNQLSGQAPPSDCKILIFVLKPLHARTCPWNDCGLLGSWTSSDPSSFCEGQSRQLQP